MPLRNVEFWVQITEWVDLNEKAEKMTKHNEIADSQLFIQIKRKEIVLAGNLTLKIYGTLHCQSGKRMLRKNRVFFSSETEAIKQGFRPCGHCMREAYRAWSKK